MQMGAAFRTILGGPTNTFIKIVLTADKPALCKVLGRRSFAHDAFSPCCDCLESEGKFYGMSFDPLTHFGTMHYRSSKMNAATHGIKEGTLEQL